MLTEALTGFLAADEWLKNHANMMVSKQRMLMRALAKAVYKLHQAGVQHRSLYLKHLFVKENNGVFDVAAIDFEKSRTTVFIRWFRLADLITLHYRTADLRAGNKLAFFKQYFAIQYLTPFYKALCRYLHQQSLHKRR